MARMLLVLCLAFDAAVLPAAAAAHAVHFGSRIVDFTSSDMAAGPPVEIAAAEFPPPGTTAITYKVPEITHAWQEIRRYCRTEQAQPAMTNNLVLKYFRWLHEEKPGKPSVAAVALSLEPEHTPVNVAHRSATGAHFVRRPM